MNKYIAFFGNRQTPIEAETSYLAQQKAVSHFMVPRKRAHEVYVILMQRPDGSQVTHSTASI
jgi:hypothetical protein